MKHECCGHEPLMPIEVLGSGKRERRRVEQLEMANPVEERHAAIGIEETTRWGTAERVIGNATVSFVFKVKKAPIENCCCSDPWTSISV